MKLRKSLKNKVETDWIDNFNSYIQRNHGYKRMCVEEYLKFYEKAKQDVLKASISRVNPYMEKEKAVNYGYKWRYAR